MTKTQYAVDAAYVMRELWRADRHLARVIRRVGFFPTKKPKPQLPFASLLQSKMAAGEGNAWARFARNLKTEIDSELI
jgi:hypothetical protein